MAHSFVEAFGMWLVLNLLGIKSMLLVSRCYDLSYFLYLVKC